MDTIAQSFVKVTLVQELLAWAESAEEMARQRVGQPDGRQWAAIAERRRAQYEAAVEVVEGRADGR